MKKKSFVLILFLVLIASAYSQNSVSVENLKDFIAKNMESYESLYLDLHQNPELSFHENRTSEIMASNLGHLGFEITRNFGGNGVVGILHNGKGPVIMLRTDMDALPIIEKTGLPYASKVVFQNDAGKSVGVMHACGHDAHMSVWTGTATVLTKFKNNWKGTLIMIAQPAEEMSGGANAMIEDGLFRKFPVPDYALALHVDPELESGVVGYCPGPSFAGVSSVDIHIYGVGGHGAYPHRTIDPIVLAARTVLDIQTIVSREISPLNPAVITVGSIHGGTKHNIIPDEVTMQLTLRFYKEEIYDQMIEALKRITRGIAASAGLPEEKYPKVMITDQYTSPVYNDPDLTRKVVGYMKETLGDEQIIKIDPLMAGEDFGKFGRTEDKVPILMFMLGSVEHEKMKEHLERGTPLPSLHSPYFAPDYQKTIETGILVMSSSVIRLFDNK